MATVVTVNRELSKFQKAIQEQLKVAEEKEKVYPITYRCPKCKDKKWFVYWENGYEYGDPCTCQNKDRRQP